MIMASVKSLEDICFSQLLNSLEEFSTNELSLLPKAFRECLLLTIPVVDVCRLEGTQFTTDIDMESIWEKLYKEYIGYRYPFLSKLDWRDYFFTKLMLMILRDGRPYGYFKTVVESCHGRHVRPCREDFSVNTLRHPVDSVNYLLAMKLDAQTTEEVPPRLHHRRRRVFDLMMNRHEVTQVKGVVPPGKIYHQACQAKQYIPPRYMKFFPEGSCYLPDLTALRLICEKCHFRPKKLWITITTINAIFLHERGDIDSRILKAFLKDVESLVIEYNYTKDGKPNYVYSEAPGTSISSEILQVVLCHTNSKLASLTIDTDIVKEAIIASIASIIVASRYSGLKELNVPSRINSSDLTHLILIAEQQESLEAISLLILKNEIHRSLLLSFFQICFQKPSFRHMKVRISPVTDNFLAHVLVAFLSTPCSHEQTFTLWESPIYNSPISSSGCRESGSAANEPQLAANKTQLPPPSIPIWFSNRISRNKSIEFRSCLFKNSFGAYQLNPEKLIYCGQNHSHFSVSDSASLSALASFDMETLEIKEVHMTQIAIEHNIRALLSKKSMRTMKLIKCKNVNHEDICRIASEQGFDVRRDRIAYTITRQ